MGEIIKIENYLTGRLKTRKWIEEFAREKGEKLPELVERRRQQNEAVGDFGSPTLEEIIEVAKDEEKAFDDLVSEAIKNCNPKSRLFSWTPDN